MTEIKFTPGPWHKEDQDEFGDLNISSEAHGRMAIACVPNGEVMRLAGKADEHIANAHLIASAPEMYAMLEKVFDRMGKISKGNLYFEIEDLLKKARGLRDD